MTDNYKVSVDILFGDDLKQITISATGETKQEAMERLGDKPFSSSLWAIIPMEEITAATREIQVQSILLETLKTERIR